MSEAVPSIMAHSWQWGSQIAVKNVIFSCTLSIYFLIKLKHFFTIERGGGGGGGGGLLGFCEAISRLAYI